MQAKWFEGHILAELQAEGKNGTFPVQVVFTNNGVMSVTVGNEAFRPDQEDLETAGTWAAGVAKAMRLPDEQVFVGAYRSQVNG